jgi:hypothetical protein
MKSEKDAHASLFQDLESSFGICLSVIIVEVFEALLDIANAQTGEVSTRIGTDSSAIPVEGNARARYVLACIIIPHKFVASHHNSPSSREESTAGFADKLKLTIVLGNCTHYHRTIFCIATHWTDTILRPAERHNTVPADATESWP